jgi:hypothetical protein
LFQPDPAAVVAAESAAALYVCVLCVTRFVTLHKRMPTQREVFDGMRIGSWCNKRRLQYKQVIAV